MSRDYKKLPLSSRPIQMAQLRRTHTGIDCSIREEHPKKWTISINYHLSGQSPYSALIVREVAVDEVKSIADNEVQKTATFVMRTAKTGKQLELGFKGNRAALFSLCNTAQPSLEKAS